ncbi:MAG TPA: class I SAM-dependent methyltransferase [Candidatus Margulisiibacteriota bacterium]|nr:class I SAM-dependent methyltransferase [Candidatus Margulisiibacteriota bacterium]
MSELQVFFDDYRLKLLLKHYSGIGGENNVFRGATVLDVGGGEGKEAVLALEYRPRFFVLLDKDFAWLKNARVNLSHLENKTFLCADAESLPLNDKCVDIVIFRDILHHLLEAYNGIKEGIRVSRKVIFIDEPAEGMMRNLINWLLVSFKKKDKYEIRDGRELKFRINRKLLERIREEQGVELFYFSYFYYHFGFFDKVENGFLKILIKKMVVIFNTILPVKNRAMIIILPQEKRC